MFEVWEGSCGEVFPIPHDPPTSPHLPSYPLSQPKHLTLFCIRVNGDLKGIVWNVLQNGRSQNSFSTNSTSYLFWAFLHVWLILTKTLNPTKNTLPFICFYLHAASLRGIVWEIWPMAKPQLVLHDPATRSQLVPHLTFYYFPCMFD